MLSPELKKWGCVPASSTLPTPNKDRVQLSHQPHSASFKVIVKPLYIEPMILKMVTLIISSRVIYHIILRFVDLFCIGISQTDTALTIHFLKTGCFWHNRTAIHYAFSTTRNEQVGKIKLHFDHGIKRSISRPLGVHKMMDNWLMFSASENAI